MKKMCKSNGSKWKPPRNLPNDSQPIYTHVTSNTMNPPDVDQNMVPISVVIYPEDIEVNLAPKAEVNEIEHQQKTGENAIYISDENNHLEEDPANSKQISINMLLDQNTSTKDCNNIREINNHLSIDISKLQKEEDKLRPKDEQPSQPSEGRNPIDPSDENNYLEEDSADSQDLRTNNQNTSTKDSYDSKSMQVDDCILKVTNCSLDNLEQQLKEKDKLGPKDEQPSQPSEETKIKLTDLETFREAHTTQPLMVNFEEKDSQ